MESALWANDKNREALRRHKAYHGSLLTKINAISEAGNTLFCLPSPFRNMCLFHYFVSPLFREPAFRCHFHPFSEKAFRPGKIKKFRKRGTKSFHFLFPHPQNGKMLETLFSSIDLIPGEPYYFVRVLVDSRPLILE